MFRLVFLWVYINPHSTKTKLLRVGFFHRRWHFKVIFRRKGNKEESGNVVQNSHMSHVYIVPERLKIWFKSGELHRLTSRRNFCSFFCNILYMKLQELLFCYNSEDIYNADEMDLFYQLLSNQTLSKKPMSGKKKVS